MAKPEGKDAFVRNALAGGVVFVLGCSAFSALVPEHADATQQQPTETTITIKSPTSKTTGSLPMIATPSDKKPAKKSQSGGGGGAGAN